MNAKTIIKTHEKRWDVFPGLPIDDAAHTFTAPVHRDIHYWPSYRTAAALDAVALAENDIHAENLKLCQ